MEAFRRCIQGRHSEIVGFLDLVNTPVLDELVTKQVICYPQLEQLSRHNISHTRASVLIQMMMARPLEDWIKLCECLEIHHQSHVSKIIKEVMNEATQASDATSRRGVTISQDDIRHDVVTRIADISLSQDEIPDCFKELYEQHKDESYDMTGSKKGRVLIVNVTEVQQKGVLLPRPGTGKDVARMTGLFTDLGFTVEITDTPGLEELYEAINRFATDQKNAKAASVFVILLSHGGSMGNNPYIITGEGNKWFYRKQLEYMFNTENAPLLAWKPKVFIIQASLGSDTDTGLSLDGDLNDPVESQSPRTAMFSDYLFVFADKPGGYKSKRHTACASVFVQEIDRVFREYSRTKHIMEMLTKVRYNVEARTREQGYFQIPHDVDCLKKSFYLFPEKQHGDKGSYDVDIKNKGVVLIIDVSDKKDGNGATMQDFHTMKKLYGDLGFVVDVISTAHTEDILETLHEFARNERNANAASSFVILISSYGGYTSEGPFIITGDGRKWLYMKHLEEIFNARNAPLLVSKPKVFITQAFMGKKVDYGVPIEESLRPGISLSSEITPTFSDFLFAFASRPNYVSQRDRMKGSIFVQEIDQIFREYSHTTHFVDMLTKVRYNVEAKTQHERSIQTPHNINCLKQLFYLFPGR